VLISVQTYPRSQQQAELIVARAFTLNVEL